MMANDDLGVEDLPDDLTPIITRTTRDHVSGGTYGDVWKCNYNADGISPLVAVKAFRFSDGDVLETISRKISREIGILKILRHNNIWGIATGFGRMLELPCLVSPWMPNGTLNVYLQSKHRYLTVLDHSRMLEDVSAGLRYLHSIPVMHGDITGANILIDKRGHARLIDFGLSTIVQPLLGQSHLERSSPRPGAIRYAAPEFFSSDNSLELPLEKADIYSFGCIMLQVLSGRLPWSEIGSGQLLMCIIVTISQGRGPQRPDGLPAIIDPDWDFIQKCLQFVPELRPSADEVLDFVMHRFSSSGSTRPPDDPPDDTQDGFPGDSSYGVSGSSDATERPPDILPPHHDDEPKPSIMSPRIQVSYPSSSYLSSYHRADLNNMLQQRYPSTAASRVRWEVLSVGPQHCPTWSATVYIDGQNRGYGQAHTKGAAKELAAMQAVRYLQWERTRPLGGIVNRAEGSELME